MSLSDVLSPLPFGRLEAVWKGKFDFECLLPRDGNAIFMISNTVSKI